MFNIILFISYIVICYIDNETIADGAEYTENILLNNKSEAKTDVFTDGIYNLKIK